MYSKDLRAKVIKFIKNGNSQKQAAEIFSINKNTVSSWYQRYTKEGTFLHREMKGARPSIDKEEFIDFVKSTPNAKVSDIAVRFNLSQGGAFYWLKKLGFVFKKKISPTWKRMRQRDKSTYQ